MGRDSCSRPMDCLVSRVAGNLGHGGDGSFRVRDILGLQMTTSDESFEREIERKIDQLIYDVKELREHIRTMTAMMVKVDLKTSVTEKQTSTCEKTLRDILTELDIQKSP